MNVKSIVKEIMKKQSMTGARLNRILGLSHNGLEQRLSKNVTVKSLDEILTPLGYEILIRPMGSSGKNEDFYTLKHRE